MNRAGVEALAEYFKRFQAFVLQWQASSPGAQDVKKGGGETRETRGGDKRAEAAEAAALGTAARAASPLIPLLRSLVEEEARERGKKVDLLLVCAEVARLVNGARTTSCKSAKDRTSMFHTLEVK